MGAGVTLKLNLGTRPTPAIVQAALEGLVKTNLEQLRVHPLPPLYTAGIRYRREVAGHEDWQTIVELHRSKRGDCEDLAAARASELIHAGERGARAVCYAPRPGLIHCVVRRADGRIEDPSKRLGMGGEG